MPLSQASRVNEKLYHAELLLDLTALEALTDRKEADRTSRDRHMAIEGAVVATLYTAWLHFIEEMALSCQIDLDHYSLDSLAAALTAQGRSMAVVTALQRLQLEDGSWLAALESAYRRFQLGGGLVSNRQGGQLGQIAVLAIDESCDLKCCLEALKRVIADNRALLSEW